MKKILTLLFLLICLNTFAQNTCPVSGDNKSTTAAGITHRHVDSAKNRSIIPTHYTEMQFDDIANIKVTDKRSWDEAVCVIGYIIDVKDGGQESCNCHSAIYKDTHIYLGKTPDAKPEDAIIVEATPRFRDKLGSTKDLKNYIGKKVKIYGYLFRDDEHKMNSTVDNGSGNHWRHTVWEIHPIIKIENAE